MQVFIIAALSADGFIGRDIQEPSTRWTSKEDTKHFIERTKAAGVIVMGSRTFETFGAKPLPGRRNIIYSRTKKYPEAETTSEPPEELLARLEREGVKEVAVAGGSSIYTMFAEARVVDTLILTIENIIFGQGVSLFERKLDIKVKLSSHTQIGLNTVVLEYDVIKN